MPRTLRSRDSADQLLFSNACSGMEPLRGSLLADHGVGCAGITGP